uniref:Uncharacterized protein n=1 Tax=Mycena chlorophos TaxID=658473 RepID=A0ABQ0L8L7_MYCCL|nr:predicted protein [Mycena chlorophos]
MSDSTSTTENLMPAVDAAKLLTTFSSKKLAALASSITGFYTADGRIDGDFTTIIKDMTIDMDANNYSQRLEFVIPTTPHSQLAYNNGPGGNFIHDNWRHRPPVCVSLTSLGSREDSGYTKTVSSLTDNVDVWNVNIFSDSFNQERVRAFCYAYSGTPLQDAQKPTRRRNPFETALAPARALDCKHPGYCQGLATASGLGNTGPPSLSDVDQASIAPLSSAVLPKSCSVFSHQTPKTEW